MVIIGTHVSIIAVLGLDSKSGMNVETATPSYSPNVIGDGTYPDFSILIPNRGSACPPNIILYFSAFVSAIFEKLGECTLRTLPSDLVSVGKFISNSVDS